jgi:uncharacterized protein
MTRLIKSKWSLKQDFYNKDGYMEFISDLIFNEKIQSMKNYTQHGSINCYDHCLNVSYYSYRLCKVLGLDYKCAARGAMLHDFFLYDWHTTKPSEGLHGFVHPKIALKNANKYFCLNEMEKDIIVKHMWPLTLKLPKYKESYIVTFVDKFCTILEITSLKKILGFSRLDNCQ